MIGVDSYNYMNEVTDRNPCYLSNVYVLIAVKRLKYHALYSLSAIGYN